jgi:hypothetical protein
VAGYPDPVSRRQRQQFAVPFVIGALALGFLVAQVSMVLDRLWGVPVVLTPLVHVALCALEGRRVELPTTKSVTIRSAVSTKLESGTHASFSNPVVDC